ncbi:MAG: cation:proton antiporter [Candidatus Bathyarchaeota archaeon]|nr:cation:proton antiporter [Candidatus Bathyarchaeota archaeon]
MEGGFGQFDAVYNILIMVVVITLIARQMNFPSTIAFIFAGLLAAYVPRFPLPEISPAIFLSLLLPPILFTESLTLDIEGLIDDSDTILSYAILGTALMVTAVGTYTHYILGLTWIEAFMLGIIIAPTDPVSVIATFKQLGVIKRFQLIVAGESLFNDGFAIVVYSILAIIIEAGAITGGEVLWLSLIKMVGGVFLGYIAGYIVHLIFCWTDDPFIEMLLTFIVAFGVFRLAEQFHSSGVIAVVIAGLIINYRSRSIGGLSTQGETSLHIIWEFIGFIASSFAFIFIGVSIEPNLLREFLLPIVGLSLFTVVFRYIMVDLVARILERYRGKRIPRNWKMGMTWSGLRGAVSVVLVLGIAGLGLPNFNILLALTYGVVLGSNLFQGLSMPIVVNRLRLFSTRPGPELQKESSE